MAKSPVQKPGDENNASGTRTETRAAMKKLKEVEKSLEYSSTVADVIHRLANWLGGGR